MKNSILEKLKEIEIDKEVTILFAIESGSRAWGFHSPDSDFDVRFVYMHRKEWYLTIDDKKDFIELPVNEVFDVNGYDIRKMLKFFKTTNGKIFEWIQSPIAYINHGSFLADVKKLVSEYYSPKAGLHHYLGLTRNTLENDLKSDKVKLKKYFYALRPVLAAYWIALKNECPPMEFSQLRALVTDGLLNENIDALLKQKVEVGEKFLIWPNKIIHQFIEDTFAFCDTHAKTLQPKITNTTALNQLFRKTTGL